MDVPSLALMMDIAQVARNELQGGGKVLLYHICIRINV